MEAFIADLKTKLPAGIEVPDLEEVVGRVSATSKKSLREASQTAPLRPPLLEKIVQSVGTKRLKSAAPLTAAIRGTVVSIARDLLKDPAYTDVAAVLGPLSDDELAALLKRATLFEVKPGRESGQVSTIFGALLERLRKALPEFSQGDQRADAAVAEYNRGITAAPHLSLEEQDALVARELAAGNLDLFRPSNFYDDVLDGDGLQLGDGWRLAFNGRGEVLCLSLDEVKVEGEGPAVFAQIDLVMQRLRERGMIVLGRQIPKEAIRYPLAGGGTTSSIATTAFVENAPAGPVQTPGGHWVQRVGVRAKNLRAFSDALLRRLQKQQ